MHWVSVKEGFPQHNSIVLGYIPYNYKIQQPSPNDIRKVQHVCIATDDGLVKEVWKDLSNVELVVTHWMEIIIPKEDNLLGGIFNVG